MSTRTYMNIKGKGQLLTLVQGHSDSTFSNFFFLKTAKPIEAKFQMQPSWDRGTKVCSNDPFYGKVKFGPLCFCMGKSLNNGFFRNYCSL